MKGYLRSLGEEFDEFEGPVKIAEKNNERIKEEIEKMRKERQIREVDDIKQEIVQKGQKGRNIMEVHKQIMRMQMLKYIELENKKKL